MWLFILFMAFLSCGRSLHRYSSRYDKLLAFKRCNPWCQTRQHGSTARSTDMEEIGVDQISSDKMSIHGGEALRYLLLVNGFFSNISVQQPFGTTPSSPDAAKEELLQILNSNGALLSTRLMKITPSEHLRLEYLVDVLRHSYVPIHTLPFLNLVLQGNWQKVYSNALLRPERVVPYLQYKITENIFSAVDSIERGELAELRSTTTFHWTYDPPQQLGTRTATTGILEVHSNVTFNAKGHEEYSLIEHALIPHDSFPVDVDQFLADLQRSVPFESFDPNNTNSEILFADADLRIQRIQGDKYFKVVNVFTRADT